MIVNKLKKQIITFFKTNGKFLYKIFKIKKNRIKKI